MEATVSFFPNVEDSCLNRKPDENGANTSRTREHPVN